MLGLRTGLRRGLKEGLALGLGADQLGGVPWTVDATSQKGVPATVAEWNAALAAAGLNTGAPSAIHLCQDASGSLADVTNNFAMSVVGTTQLYQQPVSGWSRLAVGTTDGTAHGWQNTAAGLQDPATGSIALLMYADVTAANTAARTLARIASTTVDEARIVNGTFVPRLVDGANVASGSNDSHNAVRPWILQHQFTSSTPFLYTDLEKITATFTALSGKAIRIGNGTGTAATCLYLYLAWFFGSAAELTSTQWKALLQTLGWAPQFV